MSMSARDVEQPATVHYEPGFIVLSYVISLVGCMSTLELLHRRTSVRGAFNWYLLIASSITMGGIGIWSMHFVGNRAVILYNGASDRQLLYNQGFTALSFFLPIMVLVVAFYLLAISGRASKVNIFIAGLLTGTAVCAMHYVGQVGIANYDCAYSIGNIVGAAIIAVVASLVALSIFFRLRDTWTDSWWKRALCAGLLAGAVSGMHWTAAVGTVYRYRADGMPRGSRTRVQTVIFCAVLSLASCIFLLAIAFVTRHRSRVHRRRAQELVLACAYFDEDNRVMVSNDGFLPYQKITNQFVRKTFGEDELNRAHPAFMWVYEASRNWSTLRSFVPGMQDYLDADPIARKYQPGYEDSIDLSRTASADFNIIFKQLFCVAADKLAGQIHESMDDLGVLFEEPLETGTTKSNKALQNRLTGLDNIDAEKGNKLFGRGRYLILNRRLNRNEAADFAALGYRFGSIFHVAESLARNMQVSHESMLSQLERMKISISRERLYPPGVHLAAFLLRPNVHAGFDILVPTLSQNQLPLINLPIAEITSAHQTLLQSINGCTVRDILKELLPDGSAKVNGERDFRWQLYNAFVQLADMVNAPSMMTQAVFSANSVQAPCRSSDGSSTTSNCWLLSVRYLGSIHDTYSQKELTYVPYGFFSAQQLVEVSTTRHETFQHRAQLEFGECHDPAKRRLRSEADLETGERRRHNDTSSQLTSPSTWSIQSLLTTLGLKKKKKNKVSRQSSKTKLNPGMPSGRSTAEPDVVNDSPTSKKHLNVSTDEVHELKTVEPSSPTPVKAPASTKDRKSDEIQSHKEPKQKRPLSADMKGTYVNDIFALFGLTTTTEKEKLQESA